MYHRLEKLIDPHFVEGLWKRKWMYMALVGASLMIIGSWYMSLPAPILDKTGKKPTFEMLSSQINREDSIFSNSWRKLWPRIPKMIQKILVKLTPSPPAAQVRIHACNALGHHGERALPLIIPKLNDPDSVMVATALDSLHDIGVSNEETFEVLTKMVNQSGYSLEIRRLALLSLIGLHVEEKKLLEFLNETAIANSDLYDSLNPESVDIFRSSSSPILAGGLTAPSQIFGKKEMHAVLQLRQSLSEEFMLSLLTSDLLSVKKLGSYLCYRSHWLLRSEKITSILMDQTFHKDDWIRLRSYSFLSDFRFRELNRLKENHTLFYRASEDPLLEIRRLAPVMIAINPGSDPLTIERLLKLANEDDSELAQRAFNILARTHYKPDAGQLETLWNASRKHSDLASAISLVSIIGKWSLGHHPEARTLLDDLSQINHPVLQMEIADLQSSIEMKHLDSPIEILAHIQEIHASIQNLSTKFSEYRNADPDDALPVSWLSKMEQQCRQRNQQCSMNLENLRNHEGFRKLLNECAEETFNPYIFEDTVLRWKVDGNHEKILPLLKENILSPKYGREVLQVIKTIGPEAFDILHVLLDQEAENSRVWGLKSISGILDDFDQMAPFLERASNDSSNVVRYNAKKLRSRYLNQKNFKSVPNR